MADPIKVIGCRTVMAALTHLPVPVDVEFETLDLGFHHDPQKLRAAVQRAVDQSAGTTHTIVLGYGLCSGAAVGIEARNCTLVVPRVDDCLAIFLGSRSAYRDQTCREPGTYFLTKNWLELGLGPFAEQEQWVKRWGAERADRLLRAILKNYTRLALIRSGADAAMEPYRVHARAEARRLGLRFEEIEGRSTLLRKMVHGPWVDEFIVVPPGAAVTFEDFFSGVEQGTQGNGCVAASPAQTGQNEPTTL